jgi:hypothetical protein
MGKVKSDGNAIAAVQAVLADLDREIEVAAAAISEAARLKHVPLQVSGEITEAVLVGVKGMPETWRSACETLALEVATVAGRVDAVMSSLEEKPRPTINERVRAGLHDLVAMRWRKSGRKPVDVLSAALVDANSLHGMLLTHRERLVATRQRIESDLVELGGHRPMLAENLAETATREGRELAGGAVLVEQYLQSVHELLNDLNGQLAPVNVLANKLTIEVERAILLMEVVSPRPDDPTIMVSRLDSGDLSHLAELLALHDREMLSSVEVDRRKAKIDARFFQIFHHVLDNAVDAAYVKQVDLGVRDA